MANIVLNVTIFHFYAPFGIVVSRLTLTITTDRSWNDINFRFYQLANWAIFNLTVSVKLIVVRELLNERAQLRTA